MDNLTKIGAMFRRLRAKLTYANVLSTTAVVFSLMGGAYANHLVVLSSDIVNGEVKTADIATGAVTSAKLAGGAVNNAKLAANAVTGAKVQDNSLTGADVNETTLSGIDAATLGGFSRNDLIRVGSAAVTGVVIDMPDCNPGLDYLTRSISVPWAGSVVVNTSFTAQGPNVPVAGTFALAARVERTAPTVIFGQWQESHTSYGSANARSNISTTDVFPVSAGSNSFALKVCDNSDAAGNGGFTIRAQMTFVYTPNQQI